MYKTLKYFYQSTVQIRPATCFNSICSKFEIHHLIPSIISPLLLISPNWIKLCNVATIYSIFCVITCCYVVVGQ